MDQYSTTTARELENLRNAGKHGAGYTAALENRIAELIDRQREDIANDSRIDEVLYDLGLGVCLLLYHIRKEDSAPSGQSLETASRLLQAVFSTNSIMSWPAKRLLGLQDGANVDRTRAPEYHDFLNWEIMEQNAMETMMGMACRQSQNTQPWSGHASARR